MREVGKRVGECGVLRLGIPDEILPGGKECVGGRDRSRNSGDDRIQESPSRGAGHIVRVAGSIRALGITEGDQGIHVGLSHSGNPGEIRPRLGSLDHHQIGGRDAGRVSRDVGVKKPPHIVGIVGKPSDGIGGGCRCEGSVLVHIDPVRELVCGRKCRAK